MLTYCMYMMSHFFAYIYYTKYNILDICIHDIIGMHEMHG